MRRRVAALASRALAALLVGWGPTLGVAVENPATGRPQATSAANVPAVKRTSNDHGAAAPTTREVEAEHPAVTARATAKPKFRRRDRNASRSLVPVNDASAKTEMARQKP